MYRVLTTAAGITLSLLSVSAIAAPASTGDSTTLSGLTAKVTLSTSSMTVDSAAASPPHLRAVFTLSNPTNQDIKYREGGLGLDWLILDSSGKTLYDANYGKMSPMFIAIRTLKAGAHIDIQGSVPLINQDGTLLEPGRYTLKARFIGTPRFEPTAAFTVNGK